MNCLPVKVPQEAGQCCPFNTRHGRPLCSDVALNEMHAEMHERHSSLDRIAARSTTRRLCRLSERRPADGAENTHPISKYGRIEATVRLGRDPTSIMMNLVHFPCASISTLLPLKWNTGEWIQRFFLFPLGANVDRSMALGRIGKIPCRNPSN